MGISTRASQAHLVQTRAAGSEFIEMESQEQPPMYAEETDVQSKYREWLASKGVELHPALRFGYRQ